MQCTTKLPGGSEQWKPCNALAHCLGAVGGATLAMRCHTPLGSGECNCRIALPHRQAAVGSGTSAMLKPTSWGDGESCP